MPRQARIQSPTDYYHIMIQCEKGYSGWYVGPIDEANSNEELEAALDENDIDVLKKYNA